MRLIFVLSFLTQLGWCKQDESLRAYGAGDRTWRLTELEGQPVTFGTTLTFPEPGRISGKGPCNSFSAEQNVPYPWFDAGAIAATRMACPDLASESAFFAALNAATLSEVAGDTLLLSDDSGVLLVFKAAD